MKQLSSLENYVCRHETERLALETLTLENMSDAYYEWLQDPEILQYLEVRHSAQTPEKIRAFVENMLTSANDLLLGIFIKDGGTHIGNIKLGPVNWLYGRGDIGIVIGDKNAWGKGYAREAIDGLCDIAFNDVGLRRLQAGAYASNKGSIKAFERAGFKHEGVLKAYWILGNQPEDEIWMARLA